MKNLIAILVCRIYTLFPMRINRFSRYDLKRETVIQRARFASWKKKRREKKGKDRSEAQIDNVRVKWTRETGYAFVKPRRYIGPHTFHRSKIE